MRYHRALDRAHPGRSRRHVAGSLGLFFVLLAAPRAHAGDGGPGSTCDGGDGVVCGPSDGGLVGDGGTCGAVGGRCISIDAGSECGELLAGLPCRAGTMCCVLSSANADGAASFDSAVCLDVASACVPGDNCCQGATCTGSGADGAFACAYPASVPKDAGNVDADSPDARVMSAPGHDAGRVADAGSPPAGSSSGCSCGLGAIGDAQGASWSFAGPLFFLFLRRRARRPRQLLARVG
jgi:hypothetical protein